MTEVPLLWLIRGEPGDFHVDSLKKIDTSRMPQPTHGNGHVNPA